MAPIFINRKQKAQIIRYTARGDTVWNAHEVQATGLDTKKVGAIADQARLQIYKTFQLKAWLAHPG